VYCYDDDWQEAKMLITMPSATKLRVGTMTGPCPATPTKADMGDYVEFNR